ncbi:hypothetical protein OC844_005893 [Tilletia horrida]|nr:hypothetical protein OC844_005893 [Tilletia horrida]
MRFTAPFLAALAVLAIDVDAKEHSQRLAPSVRQNHKRLSQSHSTGLAERGLDFGPFRGGKGTWFNVAENEVDCGGYYKPSDFVVALNQGQYGNLDARSPYCDQYISITSNGKTATAKIVDACPESPDACHWGALDMSTGLFQFFAGLDVGVIDIQWHLLGDDHDNSGSGSSGGGSSGSNPQPPSHKEDPKPPKASNPPPAPPKAQPSKAKAAPPSNKAGKQSSPAVNLHTQVGITTPTEKKEPTKPHHTNTITTTKNTTASASKNSKGSTDAKAVKLTSAKAAAATVAKAQDDTAPAEKNNIANMMGVVHGFEHIVNHAHSAERR